MSRISHQNYQETALVLSTRARAGAFRAVMFSSATSGNGTSAIVSAIARQMKERFGLNPLVVGIDPYEKDFRGRVPVDSPRSLSQIATGKECPRECIRDEGGVSTIKSGGAALYQETVQGLQRIVDELGGEFDLILVDCPAILDGVWALAAAAVVPNLILIVEAGRTKIETLDQIKRLTIQHGISTVGTILNKHRDYMPAWMKRWLTE